MDLTISVAVFTAAAGLLIVAAAALTIVLKSGKKGVRSVFRSHFTAPNIAYMALLTALAFVVTFLEFPVFPQANFLKLDFANVFFMIEGFIFGPVEAIVSIGIKELLCLTKSQTAGVGELANFLMSASYVLIPSFCYRFKKGRRWVIVFLFAACAMQTGVSVIVNRFINFPLYGALYGFDGAAVFGALWPFVIYFNLIKSAAVSGIVVLIYKPLSGLIKLTAEKVSRRRKRI